MIFVGKELLLFVVFDLEIFCFVLFGDFIGCDIEEGGEWKLFENVDDDGDVNEIFCVFLWLEDVFFGGDLCNERGIGCDTEGDILVFY